MYNSKKIGENRRNFGDFAGGLINWLVEGLNFKQKLRVLNKFGNFTDKLREFSPRFLSAFGSKAGDDNWAYANQVTSFLNVLAKCCRVNLMFDRDWDTFLKMLDKAKNDEKTADAIIGIFSEFTFGTEYLSASKILGYLADSEERQSTVLNLLKRIDKKTQNCLYLVLRDMHDYGLRCGTIVEAAPDVVKNFIFVFEELLKDGEKGQEVSIVLYVKGKH